MYCMIQIEPAACKEPSRVALFEPSSESDSTVLEESNNAIQSELSGKDDAPHVDQKNEVLEVTVTGE
jgi:hypothetical protein